MKWYLIALMIVIMGAGARTMFEIAHHGMGREHNFAPDQDTIQLIYLALWFVLMMMVNVIIFISNASALSANHARSYSSW